METQESTPAAAGDFSRKLSNYSLLAVGGVAGTVAGFESTEAALIVTSSSVQLVGLSTGPPAQAALNLNPTGGAADLIDDVRVTILTSSILSAQGINGASLAGTVGTMGFFYPTGLQASNSVSNGNFFSGNSANNPVTMNTFGTLANGTGGTLAPGVGNWMDDPNAVSAYMGVEFDIAGNTHYGWVHITWDPSADTATIIRFAYEDQAGVAAHVPEPSTLALLGLGAVGLAARRRRKDESAD